jgi:hypothetical protein
MNLPGAKPFLHAGNATHLSSDGSGKGWIEETSDEAGVDHCSVGGAHPDS